MANVIRIKRRLTTSGSGTSLPALRNAELAFNEINNTLYIGRGGSNTEVDGTGVVATPIVGEGAVWTGTATFGNVKTTGYFASGEEAYAYTNSVLPTSSNAIGGKLLSTIQYVDEAVSRGVGSGMALHPVAADVATITPIAVGSYTEKLIGFPSVRIAFTPTTQAEGLALYVLQGTPTVQGVSLVAGNRVLILNHLDNQALRGIWKIPTGATSTTPWVREDYEMVAQYYSFGRRVYVTDGTSSNKTLVVNSNPLAMTNTVAGMGWETLSWSVAGTGNLVPSGGNALFTRVVRARGSFYRIIRGKVVVDGVSLNQNDRFIFEPKNGEPGGIDPNYYPTYSTLSGFLGADTSSPDNARAGIYRVNYDKVTGGDVYNIVTRSGDLNDAAEFQAANNTNIYVTEGATYKNTYCAISTNTPFTLDTTVATFGAMTTPTFTTGILSGTPVIDGVPTVAEVRNGSNIVTTVGSIILVKNEVDASTNGLYHIPVNGGAWARHPTADTDGELVYGSYIRVKNGNVNKNSGFVLVTNLDPLDIGTDPLYFQSPQTTLDFRAGIGLARSDRTLYVKSADQGRIRVTETGVDLAFIADVGGQSVETDPATIGTAYLAVHADKYGRVLASSRDSLTADELRNKIVGVSNDDTTGTQHLVFSDSPALTGTPTAPTQNAGDNSTSIATTAYVMSNGGSSILGTNNEFTGANTFTNTTGQTFRTAATADAIIVKGGGNTAGRSITLVTDTLSGSRTVTFPDHTGDYKLVGDATTQTLTNKTLTAPKMSSTNIADTNGNELIVFPAVVASAVNEITVTNAIASARPTIFASGGDTNIDLALSGKGTGTVFVNGSIKLATGSVTSIADVNGNEIVRFPPTVANAVNEITVTNAIASAAPDISATGSDTNIDLKLTAKGTGAVNSTSNFTVSSGKALNLSNTTVTAGTDVQGQGALTNDINIVTSAPNAPSGVTLPTATAGRVVVVVNRSSQTNTVKIYPASGGTINALAANTAFSVAASSTAIFRASSATQWYSELVDLVNGTTGTLAVGNGGTGVATLTGLVKGNAANAFTAATAGTDYVVGGTTTVGKIVTQASLNTGAALQISSGSAPTSGSIGVGDFWNESGVLKFQPTGATSATTKVLAFTDSSITGNAGGLTNTLTVGSGGTGAAIFTSNGIIYGSGSNALQVTAAGTNIQVLQADASGVPTWVSSTGTGNVVRATSPSFATSVTTASQEFAVFNTTAATVNAFGAATAINMGASTGTTTINHNLTVTGNLTINGTTTTVNTNTLAVEDKNIEIGKAATLSNISSSCGSGVATLVVASTDGMMIGQAVTKVSGIGAFGATPRIVSVDSATQITLNANHASPGGIVFNVGGATDFTAIGAGVTIKGTSDKTFQITTSNALNSNLFNFTSSEHFNVVTGKTYKINDTLVLSSTALGTGVTASSLVSVGTLNSGELGSGFTTVAVARGGTGQTTFTSNGVLLGNGTTGLNVTAAGSANQVLRVPSGGGAPVFGAIDVSNSAAVTGTLAVGNGGTGTTTLTGLVKGNAANAFTAATAGTDYVVAGTATVGKIVTQAAIASAASLLITPQTANPTTLAAGDVWNNAGTLKFYNGTATKDIATTDVSGGGTGANTFTSNGVVYGGGSNALGATAAGTQYQVLRAGSGGTPAFGAINLDQTAAVTGTLPVGNGGTGVATLTGLVKGNAANAFTAATAGTDYVVAGTATVGGLLLSTTTGITAAGTTQADALALTNDINVVTTTAASTGVRLPAAAAGRVIVVVNRGANALKVYPVTSTAINALGNNVAFSVAASATLTLRGSSTTQWYAELTSESPCSLIADCTLDGGTF